MLRWAGCLDLGVQRCHITPAGSLQRARFAAKSQYVARNLPGGRHPRAARLHPAAPGDEGRRLGRAAPGRLRRRHQPGGARRDGLRPPHQRFSIQELAYWGDDQAPALQWLRSTHAALAPFASGQAYQNYVDPELTSWRQAWFGSNLARLQAVKREYDPDRLFRFRQGL